MRISGDDEGEVKRVDYGLQHSEGHSPAPLALSHGNALPWVERRWCEGGKGLGVRISGDDEG